MKFSIIVPSFNQGPYIERALRSILDQHDPDTEIIVCDGGSRDGTVAVLERFGPRLRHWVSEPDGGQADALNKCLDIATGDVIGWLNTDDLYLPGALRRVRRLFERRPAAGVVHGDRIMIDQADGVIGWSCTGRFDPASGGYNVFSETAFWRRGAMEKAAVRFDASLQFAMDLDFFSRLYLGEAGFVHLPAFLGAFRCYPSNKSSTLQHVCRTETAIAWQRLFASENWKLPAPGAPWRQSLAPVLCPMTVGRPYLWRRFVLGRRGITADTLAPGEHRGA